MYGRKERLAVLLLLLLAFGARGAALWAAGDVELVRDEEGYVQRAHALLDGEGFVGSYQSWVLHPGPPMTKIPQYPGTYQPPGYPAFLAGVMAFTDRSLAAVRFAQVLLSTLTVLLIYGIARAWFGHGTALAAGGIAAVYPNLVAFSHLLFSETLFLFLFLSAVWLLVRREGAARIGPSLLCGLLLGLSVLTRSSLVFFLPVLLGWTVWTRRDRRAAWLSCAVVVGTMVLTILPWTIRNARLHGGFVLVDTNGPYNLWRGNTPESFADRAQPAVDPDRPTPAEARYDPPFESIPLSPVIRQNGKVLVQQAIAELDRPDPTDLEIAAYAWSSAWSFIRAEPALFVARMRWKLGDLWNPTSFLIRHLHLEAYGPVSPGLRAAITWAAILSYGLVLGAGVAGLFMARRHPGAWLTVLYALFITAISALAFGLTRYRLPVMPFLIMFSAYAFRRRRVGPGGQSPSSSSSV